MKLAGFCHFLHTNKGNIPLFLGVLLGFFAIFYSFNRGGEKKNKKNRSIISILQILIGS